MMVPLPLLIRLSGQVRTIIFHNCMKKQIESKGFADSVFIETVSFYSLVRIKEL